MHRGSRRGWLLGIVGTFVALGGSAAFTACVGEEPGGIDVGDQDGGGDGIAPGAVVCKTTAECGTGSCVDGFCCNAACDGQCEACDVSGKEGTCSPVSGKPHHEACTGDPSGACAGTCDGTKTDACSYPTVACGTAASCAGGTATTAQACSNGTCGAATTRTCTDGCFEDSCLGVQQFSASYEIACALLTDTRVRCWGDNAYGQIGTTSYTTTYRTPTPFTQLDGKNVKSLVTGYGGACVVEGDGTVWCWGDNEGGALGPAVAVDPSNSQPSVPHATPVQITGISGATAVFSGSGGRFCALLAGGAAKCWGGNYHGSLGIGSATDGIVTTPTSLCAPGSTGTSCTAATGITQIVEGDSHGCAIFGGGQVACWGANDNGELGFAADAVAHPNPVEIPGLKAVALAAGASISCAATTDGATLCWGRNDENGRLGIGVGGTNAVPTPSPVCTKQDCSATITGSTAVSTYDESSCALAGGAVRCWGSNGGGQLGDGTTSSAQNYAATTTIASGALAVVSGGGSNFAIVQEGSERTLKCWGGGPCGEDPDGGGGHFVPVSPKWQ